MNTSIFVIQWKIRAKIIFWESCFPKDFVQLEPSIDGLRDWKLGAGLLKLHSTGLVKFFLGNFFWKTFNFANFCRLRYKYLRSFGKNFLTMLSKLHSSSRKEFFEEKDTLWKKTLRTNVSGLWAKKFKFLKSFLSRDAGLKSTCPAVFLEERSFF